MEIPHFAALRGTERELVILRSEMGESWREHHCEHTEEELNQILNGMDEGEGRWGRDGGMSGKEWDGESWMGEGEGKGREDREWMGGMRQERKGEGVGREEQVGGMRDATGSDCHVSTKLPIVLPYSFTKD